MDTPLSVAMSWGHMRTVELQINLESYMACQAPLLNQYNLQYHMIPYADSKGLEQTGSGPSVSVVYPKGTFSHGTMHFYLSKATYIQCTSNYLTSTWIVMLRQTVDQINIHRSR